MSDSQVDQREEFLTSIYYDINNPGSFGGAKRLYEAAKQRDPSIDFIFVKEWLKNQSTYTNFRQRKKKFERLAIIVDRLDEQ